MLIEDEVSLNLIFPVIAIRKKSDEAISNIVGDCFGPQPSQ